MIYEDLQARYHALSEVRDVSWETFLQHCCARRLAATILELETRIEDLYSQIQDAAESAERD